jgi:hypothetical protein
MTTKDVPTHTSFRNQRALSCALVVTLAAGLVGCKADVPRKTTNSTSLSGLWRMVLDARTDQINSSLGFSFTLVDNGDNLVMVPCAGRGNETLSRRSGVLGPVIVGDASVINNDTLRIDNEFGRGDATKMAVTTQFDMGNVSFSSTALGNLDTKDVCSNTVTARYLGVSALDTVTAYTRHNGKLLGIELSKVGSFGLNTYVVGTEMTQVSVALESDLLLPRFRESRVNLTKGTLKITKSSNVWLHGELAAQFPDGSPFTATFQLEKP